jgi:hypothetical protein
MKNALEFGLKSFFAGCLGMLGAISMVVAAAVIFGLIFKSQIQGLQKDTAGMFQSIPDMLSEGLSGMDEEDNSMAEEAPTNSENTGELPGLFVYLTEGEHPDNQKLTTFSKGQATNISIWVKSPIDPQIKFNLEIILPDGTKHPLTEEFDTDPSGDAVFCGKLNLPESLVGDYVLKASPIGSSLPAGTLQFNITE